MITITAEQLLRPGTEDTVDELMRNLTSTVLENEPGCVRFDYVVDSTNPQRRLVIEGYRDRRALEVHQGTVYLAEFIPKLLAELQKPPTVIEFTDAFPTVGVGPYFHTGIVVPDLAEAVKYYSDSLGVQFTDPGTFVIPRLEDPDPHPFDFVAVLSRTEPPYLELIQADGDGIVSRAQCGQILYHGYWEPDMAGRLDWLKTEGPGVDAVFRMEEDGVPFSMITSRDRYGNRIEYVGSDAADPLTEWARTGILPTGIGA